MARSGEELRNPTTGETLRFVRTAADTAGELLELEASWHGGGPPPPAHYHPRQEERFEILDGTLEVELDGERRTLSAGDAVLIPPRAWHQIRAGGEGCRFLCCCAPPYRHEDTYFS